MPRGRRKAQAEDAPKRTYTRRTEVGEAPAAARIAMSFSADLESVTLTLPTKMTSGEWDRVTDMLRGMVEESE
jgi:hypothetical protein